MAIQPTDPNAPDFTRDYLNLADERLGALALSCSDDFFAPMQRMLNPAPAEFIPGKYDEHGKWMDGWESRRKRHSGHDHAIVALARRCRIRGLDIDTSHFTGNYPPAAAIEACDLKDGAKPDDNTVWQPLLPTVSLQGNSHHYHALNHSQPFTHLRLNIYPDGGVARLRVYGEPHIDWSSSAQEEVDLAAAINGGRVITANNQHFGLASNLLMPNRGANMGDGWETRRRREPGFDWCIVALATPGVITRIEVDTAYFRGNFPDSCSLNAALAVAGSTQGLVTQSMFWPTLLPAQKLAMHQQHFFSGEVERLGTVSHVRFNIHPDGGVSRLRLWGRPAL